MCFKVTLKVVFGLFFFKLYLLAENNKKGSDYTETIIQSFSKCRMYFILAWASEI